MERKYKFKRWFMHWCAFQITACKLNVWKPIFLLHDIGKPFMNLVLSNEMVKIIHKATARHHLVPHKRRPDYVAGIIDWECSRMTKDDAVLNARETLYDKHKGDEKFDEVLAILDKLGL